MNMVQMKVAKLAEQAQLPAYATDGSACLDFFAAHDATVDSAYPAVIGTGIAAEVPAGYALLLFSRSGHGFKNDVRLSNCVGVIDSDYRGEIRVRLRVDETALNSRFVVHAGDRIAQGMLVQVPAIDIVQVGSLSDTARGTGGFGSTGR